MTDDRLTHHATQAFFQDLNERFAGHNGKLWHAGAKRWLTGRTADFYMLNVGAFGGPNLLSRFSQAGFSFTPLNGKFHKAVQTSDAIGGSGFKEVLCALPLRAMGFRNGASPKELTRLSWDHRAIATSHEAVCMLLLESICFDVFHKSEESPKTGLLDLLPSPIVWTFVKDKDGGYNEPRELNTWPGAKLVALVSKDAKLGSQGIVEAEHMNIVLGRQDGKLEPSDTIIFSLAVR